MNPIYLGVDVAGARNTWVSALVRDDERLAVVHGPCRASLQDIVGYCEDNDVVAAAIDAQLTMALTDEYGLRTSDMHLRLLPSDCRNWVMPINGLMAVPIRGRLLADHLSPTVGTILETHPRASLCLGLGHAGGEINVAVRRYKSRRERPEARRNYTRTLWERWSARFGITHGEDVPYDGALDSLVCATVAYLFHHAPATLYKLNHEAAGKTGRGPFYVLNPNSRAADGAYEWERGAPME